MENHVDIEKAAVVICGAIETFVEKVYDAIETISIVVSELVEEIKEVLNMPTTKRYKTVKFVSKCLGVDKRRVYFVWHKARNKRGKYE